MSSGNNLNSFSLLQLPRELRDRIYDAVLDLETPVPDSTYSTTKRRTIASRKGRTIYLPLELPAISSGNLLRCNRQVFGELSQTISSRNSTRSRGLTCKLDLMIQGRDPGQDEDDYCLLCKDEDSQAIFPTWVSLPAPISHLKHVHVNFRVRNQATLSWAGDGGPGWTTQSLLHLLGCFFAYGPSFTEARKPREPFWIDELRLDADEVDRGRQRRPVFTYLCSFLGMVAGSGVLGGRLGKLSLYHTDMLHQEWAVINHDDVSKTVEEWSRYGWVPQEMTR
ncbi:MAG: hypothetical protein Q9201_003455 [Fulgogasparrea decipioides]